MTDDEIADAVIAYTRQMDHVTFAELERVAPGMFGGTLRLGGTLKHGGVAVYWYWFSKQGIRVIESRRLHDAVAFTPCEYLCYLIDGKVPNAPVIASARKFKGERWLPLVARPIEKVPVKARWRFCVSPPTDGAGG